MKTTIKYRGTKVALLALVSMLVTTPLFAQQGGGGQGGPRGAPPEAIEACEGLAVDDPCEFSGRRGDATGTCFSPEEEEGVLACRPSDMDRSQQRD